MCLADSASPGRPLASLRSLKANISACCFRCKLPAERGGDHPSFLSSWGPHVWPPCRLRIGAGLLVPSDRSCKWQVICGAAARCFRHIFLWQQQCPTTGTCKDGTHTHAHTHTHTSTVCFLSVPRLTHSSRQTYERKQQKKLECKNSFC